MNAQVGVGRRSGRPPLRGRRHSPHDFQLELVERPAGPASGTPLAARACKIDPIHEHPSAVVWRAELPGGEPISLYLPSDSPWLPEVESVLRRLCAEPPIAGVLGVREVDPGARAFACERWSVGTASDLVALGWDLERRLALFATVCAAVSSLHERGVALGRLWPGAVVLSDALHARLDVFAAIAPASDARGREALRSFVAPEIDAGGGASVAADVFSLGRLLRFVATSGGVEPLLSPLEAVIERACAPQPERRHPSVAAFVAHLHEALGRLPAPAAESRASARPTSPKSGAPERRRGPFAPLMLLAGIGLVLFAMALAFVPSPRAAAMEGAAALGAALVGLSLVAWRRRG